MFIDCRSEHQIYVSQELVHQKEDNVRGGPSVSQ